MPIAKNHLQRLLTGIDYQYQSRVNPRTVDEPLDKAGVIIQQYDTNITSNEAAEKELKKKNTGEIIYHPIGDNSNLQVASVIMPNGQVKHFTFKVDADNPNNNDISVMVENKDEKTQGTKQEFVKIKTSISEFVENELLAAKIAMFNTKDDQKNEKVVPGISFNRIRVQNREDVESSLRSQDTFGADVLAQKTYQYVAYAPMGADQQGQHRFIDVSVKLPGMFRKVGHLRFEFSGNEILRNGMKVTENSIQEHIEKFAENAIKLLKVNEFTELSKKMTAYEKKLWTNSANADPKRRNQQNEFGQLSSNFKRIERDILEGIIKNPDELKARINAINNDPNLREFGKRHAHMERIKKFHVAPKFTNAIRHAATKIKQAIKPHKHAEHSSDETHKTENHHRRKR